MKNSELELHTDYLLSSFGATDLALVRVSSEPAFEHGPGIVDDSGERSDAHPV
jgi:hypothetical protein